MALSDYIETELILLDLQSANRDEVIEELVDTLVSQRKEINRQQILKAVIEREQLGSTGIGEGIALPHGKFSFVERPTLVFGRSLPGIRFEAIDSHPVHLVFLVLGSTKKEHQQIYLDLMKDTARLLKQEVLRKALLSADKPSRVKELIQKYEG